MQNVSSAKSRCAALVIFHTATTKSFTGFVEHFFFYLLLRIFTTRKSVTKTKLCMRINYSSEHHIQVKYAQLGLGGADVLFPVVLVCAASSFWPQIFQRLICLFNQQVSVQWKNYSTFAQPREMAKTFLYIFVESWCVWCFDKWCVKCCNGELK